MVLVVYLIILALYLSAETILVALNVKHLKYARDLSNYGAGRLSFSCDVIERSIAYSRSKLLFGLLSSYSSALLLVAFVWFGWFAVLDNWVIGLRWSFYSEGVLYIFVVMGLLLVYGIPFSLYATFIIEEKFGFNKMTVRLWLVDFFKSLLLSLIFLAPLLYALLWFMNSTGEYWWLYAWVFLVVFQLAIIFVYPIWIAPLFNKFERMPEGPLRSEILSLTKKLDYVLADIYQMDGSRRSAHSNAYFTGIGKNRRIVLFDTLIAKLSSSQLVAVLAHEIGHQRMGHVKKMFCLSALTSLFGFLVLDQLISYQPLFFVFGFERVTHHGALVLLIMASEPIVYFLSPLFNSISRRFEFQADRFAVRITSSSNDLSDALSILAKDNLTNLTPHPAYSFFHYSHPTLMERLTRIADESSSIGWE